MGLEKLFRVIDAPSREPDPVGEHATSQRLFLAISLVTHHGMYLGSNGRLVTLRLAYVYDRVTRIF